ncbi:MFS transporter, partial [candidate division KSB1 bacterium]|nr:MFS transporter [candidate division KSB1 bacterium]
NKVQTAESTHGLLLLFSLIPALVGIISLAFCFFYPLSDDRVEEMISDLKVRREAGGEDVAQ